MTYLTNEKRRRLMIHGTVLALLIPIALAGGFPAPATAQSTGTGKEIRVAVTGDDLRDARSLAKVRRQIQIAADALCGSGGLASLYRDGARRCREQALAGAERQLEKRIVTRLAGRASSLD